MRLTHGRISVELHELARRQGPALLLLHALYGSSEDWGEAPAVWPGSVYALDFAGHGRSEWLTVGGYYPELLVADADVALAHIGSAAIAGAGLGAYVALLLAGTRPDAVPAALLLPGAGLSGIGPAPNYSHDFPAVLLSSASPSATRACDPLVHLLELSVRPPDYAAAFARHARHLFFVEDGEPRPPWWEAARRAPHAEGVGAEPTAAFGRLAARAC
jgi:pimeloyl-ACP methyl ester carboxylesterase